MIEEVKKGMNPILTMTGAVLAASMSQHDHVYAPKPLPTKLSPREVKLKLKRKAKRQAQRKARKIERMHRK